MTVYVLRVVLAFIAIRNEGVHLGLLKLDHPTAIKLIPTLTMGSLMV